MRTLFEPNALASGIASRFGLGLAKSSGILQCPTLVQQTVSPVPWEAKFAYFDYVFSFLVSLQGKSVFEASWYW